MHCQLRFLCFSFLAHSLLHFEMLQEKKEVPAVRIFSNLSFFFFTDTSPNKCLSLLFSLLLLSSQLLSLCFTLPCSAFPSLCFPVFSSPSCSLSLSLSTPLLHAYLNCPDAARIVYPSPSAQLSHSSSCSHHLSNVIISCLSFCPNQIPPTTHENTILFLWFLATVV